MRDVRRLHMSLDRKHVDVGIHNEVFRERVLSHETLNAWLKAEGFSRHGYAARKDSDPVPSGGRH